MNISGSISVVFKDIIRRVEDKIGFQKWKMHQSGDEVCGIHCYYEEEDCEISDLFPRIRGDIEYVIFEDGNVSYTFWSDDIISFNVYIDDVDNESIAKEISSLLNIPFE